MPIDPTAATHSPTRGLIDTASKLPLYHQLYVLLRNRIANRSLMPGELLPGEQELCNIFGISRITAKRALDELASAGLVVREQGRGTRVLPSQVSTDLTVPIEGHFENTTQTPRAASIRLLEFDYRPASDDIAEALQLQAHSLVQRAVRVRYMDNEPLSYLVTYVPESIGQQYSQTDMTRSSLIDLLEQLGIEVASAHQSVSACSASAQLAPVLEVPEGSPLTQVYRLIQDRAGKPVEFIRAYYRPDRYRIEMDIVRVTEQHGKRWRSSGSL